MSQDLNISVGFGTGGGEPNIGESAKKGIDMSVGFGDASTISENKQTSLTLAKTNAQLVEQVLPTLRGGLQTKEVSPTDIEQVITPDDDYLGLQRVKVAPYEREVQVVNRRANESEYLYYMEDIATQYQRSDYAVAMAGEFYKNADTTILAGADAYLTSDGDFYTSQTTHTWHDDDDMHANRWVVYYFKEGENKSNFIVASNDACPYILAVKGHLGAIGANYQSNIKDIIVPDGSSVLDLRFYPTQPNMSTVSMYVKNVLKHTSQYIHMNLYLSVFATSVIESTTYLLYSDVQYICFYAPRLKKTSGGLNGRGGSGYKIIYVPELESCVDLGYTLGDNVHLTRIDAPKLKYVYGSSGVIKGINITEINLPLLEGIPASGSGTLQLFTKINSIEEINLPNLKGNLSRFDYHGCVVNTALSLKRIILPNFVLHIGASLAKNCPALEYIYIPKTTIIQSESYDGNWLSNMPKLHTFIAGILNQNGHWSGTNAYLNCPRLIHLEGVMEQNVSLWFHKWEPTEALNDNTDLIEDTNRCTTNREQFFVNFVEYILHKLQDRTGTSKLTLTLSATVYDAIFSDESGFVYNGQPIGDYVTSYIAGINWSVAKAS